MRALSVVSALVLVFTLGVGCGDEEPSTMNERQMSGAVASGCHVSCPSCIHAKPPCMAKCAIICNPQKCGNAACGAGEFCCNSSCGICAPVGGFCTQQACLPAAPTCATAADCEIYRSYCDGQATCGVYLNGEKSPRVCPPAANARYADPCAGLEPACNAGACVLQ